MKESNIHIQQIHKNLESASLHGSYSSIKSSLNILKDNFNKNHTCSTVTNQPNLLYQCSIGLLKSNTTKNLGAYKRSIQLLVEAGANPFWQDPENINLNTLSNFIAIGKTDLMLIYLKSKVTLPEKIGNKSLFEFSTSYRPEHYAKYNNTEYGVIAALLNCGMKIESFGNDHVFSLIIKFNNASTKQKIHLLQEYKKNNSTYFTETPEGLNLLELSIIQSDQYLTAEILKFPEVIEWLKEKENLQYIIHKYSKKIHKNLLITLENLEIQNEIKNIPLSVNNKRLKI